MSPQQCPRWLVLLLPLALPGGGFASGATEIYRWVDAQGITQLSQTPPVSGTYEILALPSLPAADPSAGARLQQEVDRVEAWQRERLRRQESARAALELKAERERRCQIAKKNLATLDNLGARPLQMPDGTTARPSTEVLKGLSEQARAEHRASCD